MATESSLIKTILHKSLAEGVYRDVVTRSSLYYYFLGRTLKWEDEDNPPVPVDSAEYEHQVRNEIITLKEVRASDVAFVVDRKNWVAETVYDMYDDQYTDELIGINIISGGSGYIDIYDIELEITGGGGTGAKAEVTALSNTGISEITLTSRGRGYTSVPTVTIKSISDPNNLRDSGISPADLRAVIGISATGKQRIEDCDFYVVTDEYNVYKCLDNNNGARSTVKPTTSALDPIKLTDGYIWKFMYNIPINLRNKFYTDEHIPVVSALTNHFYSNGTLDNILIANKGKNYTSAVVNVVKGDGTREDEAISLDSVEIGNRGTAYKNPSIEFAPPVTGASSFFPESAVNIGQKIYNSVSDFYEVTTPGITGEVEPTHRLGTVLNGECALKFIGSTVKGDVSTTNPQNITGFNITNFGVGYVVPPTVSIVDSTGLGAVATSTIGTSTVVSLTKVSGGTAYLNPTVELRGGGDSVTQIATAIPTVVGGVITACTIVTVGAGYTEVPDVIITDSSGSGAQYTAVLSGSPIQSIEVVSGGSGYSSPLTNEVGVGTISTGVGSDQVVGIDTDFETSVVPNQILKSTAGVYIGLVESVESDTELTLYSNAAVTYDGTFKIWSGPTVTITSAGGGGAGAVATAIVETGIIDEITLYGGVKDVVLYTPGSGYLAPPEITFVGGGGLYAVAKSKTYADKVISTYIVNPGDNYTSAPDVVFGNQWEPLLTVYTNDQFAQGSNLYTVVADGVLGSSTPTHTHDDYPVITSPEWVANTTVALYSTVYVANRLYKVVIAGMTGSTAPDHTSGTVVNGSASLQYLGKPASLLRAGTPATGYATLRYGYGYMTTPAITFNDDTGTGAQAQFKTTQTSAKIVPIIDGGQIVYLVIENPGVGYTNATLEVSGNGTGAVLVPDLSIGSIASQQANNEILTPDGTIDAIAIISGGYSYGVANISIEGDGTGAAAVAVIDPLTNAITKINITNRGQNYTYATVKVTGNGNGASLRAIISPYGGHGKNSPEELYARSLMFYSNISNDLNQGVTVNNDYRQAGIIKNPRVFNAYENFQGTVGSACYVVQSIIDTDVFAKDDDVFIERRNTVGVEWEPTVELTLGEFVWYNNSIYTVIATGLTGDTPPDEIPGTQTNGTVTMTYVTSTQSRKRYRVVSTTSTRALIQSLDNDTPRINDTFIKTNSVNDTFTATNVGPPTVDKYSGQLMYIDNKQGFTPSADETITLRTIIKF